MLKVKEFISKHTLILIAVTMFIFTSLYNNAFFTAFNISGMLMEVGFMTFLAMGMTFVILTGGIDLSVGAIAGLSSVIMAMVMKHWNTGSDGVTILLSIVLALGVCALLGYINGICVTNLGLPSLIVTLGMTWIASGVGESLIKGLPLGLKVDAYKSFMSIKLFSWIPITFLFTLVVLVVLIYVLKNFRWGREFYAVGSNELAAFISGIKVNSVKRRAFLLSGLFAGIAGLLIAVYIRSGYPSAAKNYELYTIAAVVMGGVPLTGGKGRLALVFVGVLILRILNKVVVFTGLSSVSGFIEGIIIGTILLAVLLINSMRKEGH